MMCWLMKGVVDSKPLMNESERSLTMRSRSDELEWTQTFAEASTVTCVHLLTISESKLMSSTFIAVLILVLS